MTKYNCGHIIGSLVYRAQGYKRLAEEVTMSKKFILPDLGQLKNSTYCLVTKNVVALNVRADMNQTLKVGSLVVIDHRNENMGLVQVKLIDFENKTNTPEEIIFRCSSDCLIEVNKKVWNLIAAISSPMEKINIAKNTILCKELCGIDVGSIVQVLPSSVGIVTFKGPVNELGPGTYFGVELFDDADEKHGYKKSCRNHMTTYCTADQLRPSTVSSKKSNQNDSNILFKNNFEIFGDQYYLQPETKKLEEKLNEDAKPHKSSKLKPGDRVIWSSETGEKQGSICWCSPVNSSARVHLGDSICKNVHCERSQSHSLPVCDLMTDEEYFKKKNQLMSQMKDKKYSVSTNEVRVDDLLGIMNQVDYSGFRSSCDILKEFGRNNEENNLVKSSEVNQLREDEKRFQKDKKTCPSNDSCKYEPLQTNDESTSSDELGVGSVVEVSINDEPHYGVIKWIGSVVYGNLPSRPEVAGIEMEEENPFCSDGNLHGHKYFECAPHRGYFTLLSSCKKDSRFQDLSYMCSDEAKPPIDFGCAVIPGIAEPINQVENIHLLCGKYKGIQGHNNSCYLDATLFSMFTFTSVLDNLLLRPPNKSDIGLYEEVQRVLREEIVNPLRKNLFVRAERVMKLRTLLDNLTSVTGLTCEEKDPEEFLTSLVAQVLKAEPFLKLSSGHEAYYYQLFVEKDERLILPTVQQLFEQSLITSDIKLKEVPSCLIIQMPRFGKSYKMYPRILPSQILDVTDVIENSPRQCTVCGQLAEYECKDCFKRYYDEPENFSYCKQCVKTAHSHDERSNHKWNRIIVPQEFTMYNNGQTIPRQYMELFAVLCIETSHYVAFVKCGFGPDTPWCFFDSMADRKGGLNGFNIPEMVLCPDLPMWLSDNGAQSSCEIKDDRHLPTYEKRLLCDAYMCMYQSTDVMMYR